MKSAHVAHVTEIARVSPIIRLLRRVGRVGRVGHPYHALLRCLVSSVNGDAHAMRSKPIGTDEVGSKVDGKVKTCRRRAQQVQGKDTARKDLKPYTWIVTEFVQDWIWLKDSKWITGGWVADPVYGGGQLGIRTLQSSTIMGFQKHLKFCKNPYLPNKLMVYCT